MVRINFFIYKWYSNFTKNLGINLSIIVTLTIVFLLLSSVWTITYHVERELKMISTHSRVTLYLKEGSDDATLLLFKKTLEQLPEIKGTKLYSKKEVKNELIGKTGISSIISISEVLFPKVMDIYFNQDVPYEKVVTITEQLKGVHFVEGIETYKNQLRKVQYITKLGKIVSLILWVMAIVTTIIVIILSLRTDLLKEREEIKIMQICGATNKFIMVPFVIKTVFVTLIGSLLGLSSLAILISIVERKVTATTMLQLNLNLPISVVVGVIITALIVAISGTILFLQRELKN